MNRSEQAFAKHKARHIAENIAQNLKRATSRTALTRHGEGDGGGFTVIGAGHTLPGRIEVEDYTNVLAVNSAIGACVSRGFEPAYILCRESIDLSHQVRLLDGMTDRRGTIAIVDIGVHPNTWQVCLDVCGLVLWFIPANTQTFGLAARLGVEPVYGGTSNVTAAVAVAEMMGACSIDLLGCSRAFSADGRAYATGTGWESIRLTGVEKLESSEGPVTIGTIEGLEAKEAAHAASGQRAPLKRERLVPVTAVDGSTRYALETLEGDREWLANFALRHQEIQLAQLHPDVAIEGWMGPRVDWSPERVDVLTDLGEQVEHAHSVAKATLEDGLVVDAMRFLEGSDLVDYHTVGARLEAVESMRGRPPPEVIRAILKAWIESADRMKELAR